MSEIDDFPFYNGRPARLVARQWWLVLAGVALGFVALTAPIPWFAGRFGQFVPAVLFVLIPLAALAIATPQHWTALFRRLGWRDVVATVLVALLTLVVSFAAGWLFMKYHGAQANPAVKMISGQSQGELGLFFLKTAPQLLGEELVTILPMLAFMTLFHGPMGLARPKAIALAWLLSALLFAALHLPTYQWNFAQCFAVIGAARLVLSLGYLWTRNIWVSTGAHILNDWSLFGLALALA
ncbi:MAG: CPBP family intramembrane metalloprotease [Proteobacteria bacterium]|nr:CPBP family intramembrane metalloprotease [Pseudomonadota bacterium]